MKAIVWTKYGSPEGLRLRDVPKPTPKDNEVLIRIHATTVTAGDCEIRSMKLPLAFKVPLRIILGLRKPRNIILGQELAGEIEEIGKDVTLFRTGDRVFAWAGIRLGGYAEYACLPGKGVMALIPSNMTYAEAATLPVGGLEAANFIRKGDIRRGEKLLINGAGGSIGTYAIQIAKYLGADVTAVDSTEKLDMLRSIGADHVVDYTREDFTRRGKTYDVIFDVVGKGSFSRGLKALRPNGRYLLGNFRPFHRIRARLVSGGSNKQVISSASKSASETAGDINYLKELIEAGKIRPVIDRCYPLEQTAEAHRYVEAGHKKGNLVIMVVHNDG
jgi:NADPH:quinone reductase-like Zn-dependent oxidoreductase